jgi:hypothetical protein
MLRKWYLRALFAGILGGGVMAGLARAGNYDRPPPLVPAESPEETCPGQDGKHPHPVLKLIASHPILTCIQKRPVVTFVHNEFCCWSTPNALGCGSLKGECTFIFGSCRDWYGEPCLKGAPPPLPPGWPPGYPPGTPIPGQGGCPCRQ